MGKLYHDSSMYIIRLSQEHCVYVHKMYKSKSAIPYPGWIPTEALIPVSHNAFNKPWEK